MKYGAFGLVEVVGSANAVRVVDQMLKAADVSYETWHTRCGGHATVFMSGGVSAVKTALESVKEKPPRGIVAAGGVYRAPEKTKRKGEEGGGKKKGGGPWR